MMFTTAHRDATTDRTARKRAIRRGLYVPAWLAVLLAVCLALPAHLVHFAVARHAVCSEHGELVHSEEAQAASLGKTAARAGGAEIDRGAEPEHDHEHCAYASHGRERLVCERSGAEIDAPACFGTDGARLQEREEALGRCALLSVAPKTSPPAPSQA